VCTSVEVTLYCPAFSFPVVWCCLSFHGYVGLHFLRAESLEESFVVVALWSHIVLVSGCALLRLTNVPRAERFWSPPTIPCSRNRHMSPGKCGAQWTGGCTGATEDPVLGYSNPETLSNSSRRRRGPEPIPERPPVPPGTPAKEPAEGPLRTAAAMLPGFAHL
jgi:hypothetical protein